jgi:hypothetical protein
VFSVLLWVVVGLTTDAVEKVQGFGAPPGMQNIPGRGTEGHPARTVR